jgi:hypothetical protein
MEAALCRRSQPRYLQVNWHANADMKAPLNDQGAPLSDIIG